MAGVREMNETLLLLQAVLGERSQEEDGYKRTGTTERLEGSSHVWEARGGAATRPWQLECSSLGAFPGRLSWVSEGRSWPGNRQRGGALQAEAQDDKASVCL